MFSLEDLKFGDVITIRNGEKGVSLTDKIALDNSSYIIYSCYENLTNKYEKDLDIVKVQRYNEIMSGHYELQTLYERKEKILDKKEKEYLSAVIKPFKNRVNYIKKKYSAAKKKEYILIELGYDLIDLPYFNPNTMYKGMKINKEYTLKELGL